MIGGLDITLAAPPGRSVVELITRRVRRLWPDAVCRDADQDELLPVIAFAKQFRGRELFIYQDAVSASAWDLEGATEKNRNTMLGFHVHSSGVDPTLPTEVTLVCDEWTDDMQRLVDDLRESFLGADQQLRRVA